MFTDSDFVTSCNIKRCRNAIGAKETRQTCIHKWIARFAALPAPKGLRGGRPVPPAQALDVEGPRHLEEVGAPPQGRESEEVPEPELLQQAHLEMQGERVFDTTQRV